MENLKLRFGRLLAAHRKRRGLKQADLADKAGLSIDQIAKLETGISAPSFGSIERIAKALEIDPVELFTYELGGRPYDRRALTELVAQISALPDPDLRWLGGIVSAALKPRS